MINWEHVNDKNKFDENYCMLVDFRKQILSSHKINEDKFSATTMIKIALNSTVLYF